MRESALWLYQKITYRNRLQRREELQAQGRLPIAILFYHRVADTNPNDWTMSCCDFAKQLDWLQDNYEVVPLAEAQRRIRAPRCEQPTVAITFDDGYADNSQFAIPELVRRDLPATYFVSTEFIRNGHPFPHDTRAGIPLAPNTIREIQNFHELGIEIGAHTRNHVDLGRMRDVEQIRDEIVGSVNDLRNWLDVDIQYFAFPFGLPENLSQLAVDVIGELGLSGYCSAYGAFNWPHSCGFHLRRIHADPGLERLKNWLTLDRRKLHDLVTLPVANPNHACGPFTGAH